MIRTQNLSKIFKNDQVQTVAINNLDFKVSHGEFLAIMGPSGCGKSSLLNLVGMLDSPTDGKLFFDNIDVSDFSEKQRTLLRKQNVGFVFQSFNLIDELTVYENVELPLMYLKTPHEKRKKMVLEVLDKMQISHKQRNFPQQLSGGQQQRVAVARAVVTNPKLILADEPTGNLDSANGEEVMKLLTMLNSNGTTIVMATHSSLDAQKAHRIVQLFDGTLVTEDVKTKIF